MAELPLTRIAVNTEKQTSIRDAVGKAENLAGIAHVAREKDVRCANCAFGGPANIRADLYTSESDQSRHHCYLHRPAS